MLRRVKQEQSFITSGPDFGITTLLQSIEFRLSTGHKENNLDLLGGCHLISKFPDKAMRALVNIARLVERINMRSQSRAW